MCRGDWRNYISTIKYLVFKKLSDKKVDLQISETMRSHALGSSLRLLPSECLTQFQKMSVEKRIESAQTAAAAAWEGYLITEGKPQSDSRLVGSTSPQEYHDRCAGRGPAAARSPERKKGRKLGAAYTVKLGAAYTVIYGVGRWEIKYPWRYQITIYGKILLFGNSQQQQLAGVRGGA